MSEKNSKDKTPKFPVGQIGQRELKRALVRSTDPAGTIQAFQQNHSLHSMMATAFETIPQHQSKGEEDERPVESLDTDSVLTFLSHLGVTQHEVHKRIAATLLKQVEDEIRKAESDEPVLKLLKSSWEYATTIKELRPVVQAILRRLGKNTPLAVLVALGERDSKGTMKHADIFGLLSLGLKRLVWEADWDGKIPLDPQNSPHKYLEEVKSTLLFGTLEPLLEEYCSNKTLAYSANRPFVSARRERSIITTQRRALTSSASSTTTPTTTTGAGGVLRATPSAANPLTSGKAVSKLRGLLSDVTGTASSYRKKLLYALLSILMAQHGALDNGYMQGATHLHCTLVADILLSSGGGLPKAYHHVLSLAQILDGSVQKGNLTDDQLIKIQVALRQIFQDSNGEPVAPQKKKAPPAPSKKDIELANSAKRQLNRLITEGLVAMKEGDPQALFKNPVTDEIAKGYSHVIKKPMCRETMEGKVERNEYGTIKDWEQDVELMYMNCISYNKGTGGHWFRVEAERQRGVFRQEIFPQARRLYQNEIAKRSFTNDASARKRKPGENGPEVTPLEASNKKRKKESKEYLPSMPALASMLLADPFVVRIVLARLLRELRCGVIGGSSLPTAHAVVPSLLQILHLTRWSSQICAVRGKKFFVPDAGLEEPENTEDPAGTAPFESQRRFLPLLLRLMLESELDKRVVLRDDLYDAVQAIPLALPPIGKQAWATDSTTEVIVSLVEGSLVHIVRNANETSLAVTFPKFARSLQHLTSSLPNDRTFFLCVVNALLKHKAKLSKLSRDAIVESWLKWMRVDASKTGTMTSAAHECFVMLLNEWSALGNQILPRDTLLQFSAEAVEAVNASEKKDKRKFAVLWNATDAPDFAPIKKQYERMLKHLPPTHAKQWREQTEIDPPAKVEPPVAEEEPIAKEASDPMETEEFTSSP